MDDNTPAGPATGSNPFLIVGGLALATVVGVALRDPELRRVGGAILADSQLRATCGEACKNVGRGLVAAWQRHGGTEAVLSFVGRGAVQAS